MAEILSKSMLFLGIALAAIISITIFTNGVTTINEQTQGDPVQGIEGLSSGVIYDLTGTDALDFVGTETIRASVQDSSGRIFIAGTNGLFAVYVGGITNITSDLSGTDDGDFIGTSTIEDLAYDPINNRVYLITSDTSVKFGYYDVAENAVHDLSSTDDAGFLDTGVSSYSRFIEYSTVDDAVFIYASSNGGDAGTVAGYYSRLENVTRNYDAVFDGVVVNVNTEDTFMNDVTIDTSNNAVYIGSSDGDFIQMNLTTNATQQLPSEAVSSIGAIAMQGVDVWATADGTNYKWTRATDSTASVFTTGIVGEPSRLLIDNNHLYHSDMVSAFIRVNLDGFATEDMYSLDENGFMGANPIRSLTPQGDGDLFITGDTGVFGFYKASAASTSGSTIPFIRTILTITVLLFFVAIFTRMSRTARP